MNTVTGYMMIVRNYWNYEIMVMFLKKRFLSFREPTEML